MAPWSGRAVHGELFIALGNKPEMPEYIDLNRRFVERSNYVLEELVASEISGKRLEWERVLERQVAVVVAPANSGKTTEMQKRAALLRGRSAHAVFLPLRRVAERGGVDAALDTRERVALEHWRGAPGEPLTLFLDSLDEASAGHKDSIEYLVRVVSDTFSDAQMDIRWVISTRPAVLTAEVLQQLHEVLVVARSLSSTHLETNQDTASASSIGHAAAAKREKVHLFSMAPLDGKQAEHYVAAKYDGVDSVQLLETARSRGLSGFTTTPGGLDVLAHIDLVGRPSTSLTDVFQRVVDAVQELQRQDSRLAAAGNPPAPHVTAAAQKLAAASQVCQNTNIEIPEEKLGVTEGVLSARLIAASLLTEAATTQLLNSQLFVDVGYHQVKMYPDELPPFLGAQRLAGLVQSPEHAYKIIDLFSWAAPTGEQGIYRQFLPLMGWLATFNPHCRDEVIRRDPQALAFFGDLRNDQMPLPSAAAALEESIRRIVEQGDQLGRGHFTLTSENYWQAGRHDLLPLVQTLFVAYGNHSEARDALLNIATSANADVLRQLVLSSHRNDFGKLARASGDLHYVLAIGKEEDLTALALLLKRDPDLPEAVKASLISHLAWHHLSGRDVGAVVNMHFENHRGGFNIAYALGSGLLDEADDQELYRLARSVVLGVARLARRDDGQDALVSERYFEVVAEVLEVMVRRSEAPSLTRIALLFLMVHRWLVSVHIGSDGRAALTRALEGSKQVRQTFLSLLVRRAVKSGVDLWGVLYGYDSLCSISFEDVTELGIPELSVFFEEVERARVKTPPAPSRQPRSPSDPNRIPDSIRKELSELIPKLRDASATNGLEWVAHWLLRTSRHSRYGDVDIESLRLQVGTDIADAVREGLAKLWRTQDPAYTESEPRSTRYITAAGLQGLRIELGDGTRLPSLSDGEVRRAIRYAMFEINGYPKWFWPLVNKHLDVANDELMRVVDAAGAGSVSHEHATTLLMSIGSAPAAVRTRLAPRAWQHLQDKASHNAYTLERLLDAVATEREAGVHLSNLAWSKVQTAYELSERQGAQGDSRIPPERQEALIWATYWMTHGAEDFIEKIAKWRAKDIVKADLFLVNFAGRLGGDRGGKLLSLARTHEYGEVALGVLYEWMLEIVRPEEDNQHADGEAYTPDDRDNAERFRDALLPAIASARSQLAYEVLERLRMRASGRMAEYLRSVQYRMLEDQYARPSLRQQAYDEFERTFTMEVTDTTAFAMAIHSDLLAVRYDVERGEYSLRRFFSDLHLPRAKSSDDAEASGLALEADFQRLLASELHHHARGRYSVTVEPHTAESKRRDVLCSNGDMFASIELKMSMRWTLDKYVEALDKQLVGQYMRHRGATIGFLVIVLQEKGRRWEDASRGRSVDFDELLHLLEQKARSLEAEDRKLFLRVVGIDATPPENFRSTTDTDTLSRSAVSKGRKPKRRSEQREENSPLCTRWFSTQRGERPSRSGVYEASSAESRDGVLEPGETNRGFCYWDGEGGWGCHGSTPSEALTLRYMRLAFNVNSWRGLVTGAQ